MNQFEDLIIEAIKKANKIYEEKSGEWLFHAPEHFLQNFLFHELGNDWFVYLEASRTSIGRGKGNVPHGRPPKSKNRHDLIVWYKSKDEVKAVIEIKKTWAFKDSLWADAEKLRRATSRQYNVKDGYLIILREYLADHDSSDLFKDWATKLKLKYLKSEILNSDTNSWKEAYCVMKVS